MVPVVSAEDGQWLLPEPVRPMMKPGGHGAIWKLMLDRGVFEYFSQRRRKAAIVRQIRCCHHPLPLPLFQSVHPDTVCLETCHPLPVLSLGA